MKKKIVIIGAGVTGSAIARYAARYDTDILVLEKGDHRIEEFFIFRHIGRDRL